MTENPKGYTKKLLEIINKFSKVIEYKSHHTNSIMFLYANNELSKKLRKQPHL